MDEPEFLKQEINSIVIHSRQSQWRGRQWGGGGGGGGGAEVLKD